MFCQFPENFAWGVATAAAQIDGAAFEDGRGPAYRRLLTALKRADIQVNATIYH